VRHKRKFFFAYLNTEATKICGGKPPCILNQCNRWKWVIRFALCSLHLDEGELNESLRWMRCSSTGLDAVVETKIPAPMYQCSRYRPGVAQKVGRGIALLYHDHGTRKGWVVSSTPWPHFTLGKDPVPILQEAAWAPGPVWTDRKSRPTGIRSRVVQPVAQSLYRLSYPAHPHYTNRHLIYVFCKWDRLDG